MLGEKSKKFLPKGVHHLFSKAGVPQEPQLHLECMYAPLGENSMQ